MNSKINYMQFDEYEMYVAGGRGRCVFFILCISFISFMFQGRVERGSRNARFKSAVTGCCVQKSELNHSLF